MFFSLVIIDNCGALKLGIVYTHTVINDAIFTTKYSRLFIIFIFFWCGRGRQQGAAVAHRNHPVALPVQDQQRCGNSNADGKGLSYATANISDDPYFLL